MKLSHVFGIAVLLVASVCMLSCATGGAGALHKDTPPEHTNVECVGRYTLKPVTTWASSFSIEVYVYRVKIGDSWREVHWNGRAFRECSFGVLDITHEVEE